MYTSGSTGYPKGVLGTHEGLINRLVWQYTLFPFEPRSSSIGDDNDDSEESEECSQEGSVDCSEEAVNRKDFVSYDADIDHHEEETSTVLIQTAELIMIMMMIREVR